jgi:hypothetical protein
MALPHCSSVRYSCHSTGTVIRQEREGLQGHCYALETVIRQGREVPLNAVSAYGGELFVEIVFASAAAENGRESVSQWDTWAAGERAKALTWDQI